MPRVVSTFVGLAALAIGFVACGDDSTSSPAPGVDAGSFDGGSSTSDGGPPVSVDSGTPTPPDGATPQRPTGFHLRFAHLAESHKDEQIDFCLKPKAADDFTTPVHAPLGAPGLNYGEVGRFIPIQPGEYDYVAKSTPNCDGESIESGEIVIPSGIGSWALVTFALTLTSTGVISLQTPDFEMHRNAAQDRITVIDGTGPRDALTKLPVSWVGSTTVNLDIPNNTRSASALVPAGESGKVTVGLGGNPEIPVKTIAGGHALVVVYGTGEMRVCDHDAPIPTTGALSTCVERK